jgi:hypothetical protein
MFSFWIFFRNLILESFEIFWKFRIFLKFWTFKKSQLETNTGLLVEIDSVRIRSNLALVAIYKKGQNFQIIQNCRKFQHFAMDLELKYCYFYHKSKDRQHNCQKKNGQKDKYWSTKHYKKTKDRVTRTPLTINQYWNGNLVGGWDLYILTCFSLLFMRPTMKTYKSELCMSIEKLFLLKTIGKLKHVKMYKSQPPTKFPFQYWLIVMNSCIPWGLLVE